MLPDGAVSDHSVATAPVARQFRLLTSTACTLTLVPTVPAAGVPLAPLTTAIPATVGPTSPQGSTFTVMTPTWELRPVWSVATTPSS